MFNTVPFCFTYILGFKMEPSIRICPLLYSLKDTSIVPTEIDDIDLCSVILMDPKNSKETETKK